MVNRSSPDQRSFTARALTLHSVLDIPFVHAYQLDEAEILRISGLNRLGDLNARNVVVVDTLRALSHTTAESFFRIDDASRALAPDLRRAMSTRQAVWLCAVPVADLPSIKAILGDTHVHTIGLGADADGSKNGLVPIAVSPKELVLAWARGTQQQRHAAKIMLEGADSLVMFSAVLAALRGIGADIIERHVIGRSLANPKVLAYLVVAIYSSLRALPVAFVPGFHGNMAMLWAIDIVTAVPYTWGIIEMFAGSTVCRRIIGLIVTLVTFVSPYLYFWYHGRDYPMWVSAVVTAMIVGAIAIEYFRWVRDRIVARSLRATHTRS